MKTYAVHYGHGHLGTAKVMAPDYRSLRAAEVAAEKLVRQGYELVLIADTDGNEWEWTE